MWLITAHMRSISLSQDPQKNSQSSTSNSNITNRRELLKQITNAGVATLLLESFGRFSFAADEEIEVVLEPGDKLPDIELQDIDGNKRKLSSYINDNICLIEFWSSECGPCIKEIPNLNRALSDFKDKKFINANGETLGDGFDIVAISLDEDRERWIKTISDVKPNWNNQLFGDGWDMSYQKFGIRGLPYNFLVDKDGKILTKNLRAGKLIDSLRKLEKASD